jgi:hypothetical protein
MSRKHRDYRWIYHLCAKVDPDLDHAESNEDDNTVFLHHTVTVF